VKNINVNESIILDFLRSISALLVLVAHTQQIIINPTWMPYSLGTRGDIVPFLYSQIGSYGVVIFFVLSGFLISYVIMLNLEKNNRKMFDFNLYIKKRIFRLYPPLLFSQLFILFIFFVLFFFDKTNASSCCNGNEIYVARSLIEIDWSDYFSVFIFLNTILFDFNSPSLNGPLWSIAQEFWFYLIAGVGVVSFFEKKIIIFFVVIVFFLYAFGSSFFFYGLFVWGAGCVAAVVHCLGWCNNNKNLFVFLFLLFSILWVCSVYYSIDSYIYFRQKFIFGLSFSFFLPLLLSYSSVVNFFSSSRVVRRVAYISGFTYTLYLIHFPFLLLVFFFTNLYTQGNIVLVLFVSLLACIVILIMSDFISRFLEKGVRENIKQRICMSKL